jgi:hypothetical protein
MKKLAYLLLSCAALSLGTTSCSKNEEPTPVAAADVPRDYQVEYRVSSSTDLATDYLAYDNETGGTTTLGLVPLPTSYSFKRNMKKGDHLRLLASIPGGTASSEVTVTIFLDGKQVKQDVGRGIKARAVPVYIIGE